MPTAMPTASPTASTTASPTASQVRQAHQSALETAARLVDELAHVPAGVVLRSYWRALHATRHSGCPVPARASEAERLTRELLRARGVRVPRPRGVRVDVGTA
jgi:hypothetical protein